MQQLNILPQYWVDLRKDQGLDENKNISHITKAMLCYIRDVSCILVKVKLT